MTTEKDNWALGKNDAIEPVEVETSEEPQGNWLSGLVSPDPVVARAENQPSAAVEDEPPASVEDKQALPTPKPVPKVVNRPEQVAEPPKKAPLPLDFQRAVSEPRVSLPAPRKKPPVANSTETAGGPKEPFLAPRVTGRQMVSFYRSISVMLSSGVQLFACFEFLSRDAESKELSAACKRIGQRLVEGYPLPRAVAPERSFFDDKTVRLLEVGYKSGALNKILKRLAEDEEASWKLESQLQSQLYYPLGIAALGTLGVLVLPPLVLNDLLQQVVKFTDEPPAITQALLSFSAFLSSPWTIGLAVVLMAGTGFFIRTPYWSALKRRLELFYWEIPGVSELWQSVVAVRFLSVFALTMSVGYQPHSACCFPRELPDQPASRR